MSAKGTSFNNYLMEKLKDPELAYDFISQHWLFIILRDERWMDSLSVKTFLIFVGSVFATVFILVNERWYQKLRYSLSTLRCRED